VLALVFTLMPLRKNAEMACKGTNFFLRAIHFLAFFADFDSFSPFSSLLLIINFYGFYEFIALAYGFCFKPHISLAHSAHYPSFLNFQISKFLN
jgi:hypothetical protein